VEVAVFAPLARRFTYRWPAELDSPCVGIRVRVPFGRGLRMGVVVHTGTTLPEGLREDEVLDVVDRLDAYPPLDARRMQWLKRLRQYYLANEGEVWETALAWLHVLEDQRFRCHDPAALGDAMPALTAAFPDRRARSLRTIARRCGPMPVCHWLRQAQRAGLIEAVAPEDSQPETVADEPPARVSLTPRQRRACEEIESGRQGFAPFLLFGCTGSGKTEVYLRAAESIVREGGQVLVLVPEIGLTPMWLRRVTRRFERVGIWHSGLGASERLREVLRLERVQVLIGTRSALFLPLPRLRMIVVDEEHDASFKQQDGLRYSARDMAVLLAQQLSIPIVLGSATPSQESWRCARAGQYRLLRLPERIANAPRVRPEIIDMRQTHDVISSPLLTALRETLQRGEQSILFLNRRGFAQALQCAACGHVVECPHCSMRLTLHRQARLLRCHVCGHARRATPVCEQCGEQALLPLGEGTEKVEQWLRTQLPEYRFARLDRDAVSTARALQSLLDAFGRHELDGLIGTQMLVKGHHFPNVTLVGVINADLGMSMPDFRAGERWWQQMVQVMGRCGRGERAGRMLIQTRMPDSLWLHRLLEHDEERVLDEELQLRRQMQYPPFARWVRLLLTGRRRERVWQAAEALAERLETGVASARSGPMACPLERMHGEARVELLLRDASRRLLPWGLGEVLAGFRPPTGVRLKVDVDPVDMM